MKKALVACCLVALFGCGGADETLSKSVAVASKADLDPSDTLNLSCFNVDSGFGSNSLVACIYTPTAAGSSTTSKIVMPIAPDNGGNPCWTPGDVVWDNITFVSATPPVPGVPGYRTYSMRRHSAGANHTGCTVTDTPQSGTIYCYLDASGNCGNTGTQWNGIYETSPIVNHVWYPYTKPAQECTGGHYVAQLTGDWEASVNPSFDESAGSAALTAVPAGQSCWAVGDTTWPTMTHYGSGWVNGTRQSPGAAGRTGCSSQTVSVTAASGFFSLDCSHFTEYTTFGVVTWNKL